VRKKEKEKRLCYSIIIRWWLVLGKAGGLPDCGAVVVVVVVVIIVIAPPTLLPADFETASAQPRQNTLSILSS
jgi:hypothetical protein